MQNSYVFVQKNAFENVVCEMAAICLGLNVFRPRVITWRMAVVQPPYDDVA